VQDNYEVQLNIEEHSTAHHYQAVEEGAVVKISPQQVRDGLDTGVVMDHEMTETRVSVVGDMMFHNTQLFRAYDSQSRSFSFDGIFEYVAPYIETADYAFGNLETTLHGPYGSVNSVSEYNYYGYSGYPRFNTPDSFLDELVSTGFDFMSTANNHCLDRGYDGMVRTIEKLDKAGIAHTGTFASFEEREAYEWVEVNNISFAVVNYTYSTNGLYLSDDLMPLVNNMELYQEDLVQKLYDDVEAAEASGADYVVLMMHYGYEYHEHEDPNYQKPITYEAIRRGADIVFGGHPHVMQPVEVLYSLDEKNYEEPKVIIYSLGNFISSQRNYKKYDGHTDIGVVFNVFFEQIDDGKPRISGIGFVPTYTLWQTDKIMTIPTHEDYAGSELSLTEYDVQRMAFANQYTIPHLTQYLGEQVMEKIYLEDNMYRLDIE
jgi:poly-gamma-glutamate synthesis protein (capsule biosynthesis protein)